MGRSRTINNWNQFGRKVRSKGCNLLKRLDEFPNSILVTGCQRSGTTMLAQIITQSDGMVNYWFGRDDELDAALILAGFVEHEPRGRYCFQTTYLNECYHEYFEHCDGHTIIWVIRNPFSVVYSMLYNWRRFALAELFHGCGASLLNEKQKRLYDFLGISIIGRTKRACLCYQGKLSQLFEVQHRFNESNLLVIDYDDLVTRKGDIFPPLYRFLDLQYNSRYAEKIHTRGIDKRKLLSKRQFALIDKLCKPIYEQARRLVFTC